VLRELRTPGKFSDIPAGKPELFEYRADFPRHSTGIPYGHYGTPNEDCTSLNPHVYGNYYATNSEQLSNYSAHHAENYEGSLDYSDQNHFHPSALYYYSHHKSLHQIHWYGESNSSGNYSGEISEVLEMDSYGNKAITHEEHGNYVMLRPKEEKYHIGTAEQQYSTSGYFFSSSKTGNAEYHIAETASMPGRLSFFRVNSEQINTFFHVSSLAQAGP